MPEGKFPNTQINSEKGPSEGSLIELDLWGPPPLLPGEDPAIYEAFRRRIYEAVKPSDFIEETYVRDALDLTWQARGLRRLKEALLRLRVGAEIGSTIAASIAAREKKSGQEMEF